MEDHAYADQALSSRNSHSAPQSMPLTALIREQVDTNISTAARTFNTLTSLRDRLLGYPPPSPVISGSNTKANEAISFADAMRQSNNELTQRLQSLEALAEEMSSRL